MKHFKIIRSTNDLPEPGKTVYLIYIRYYDYKDGQTVSLNQKFEDLNYAFGFARYTGNGTWEQIDGERVGFIENLAIYRSLPSAGYKPLEFTYPDDHGGSDIITKYDVIAFYELPISPSKEKMQAIPQAV